MTAPHGRPLLFLDADGTLIPFGVPSQQGPVWQGASARPFQARDADYESRVRDADCASQAPEAGCNPLLAMLNREHGRLLLALGCDLVWASSWMAEANEEIAPRIGLPQLLVVDWPEDDEDQPAGTGVHWKTSALAEWAAGRPFAWVDDKIRDADRAWGPYITQAGHCCIASTRVRASSMATSPPSTGG